MACDCSLRLPSYPIAGTASTLNFSIRAAIPTIVMIRLRSKHVASNDVSACTPSFMA